MKKHIIYIYISLFVFIIQAHGQSNRVSLPENEEVKPLMVGQRVPEGFWTKQHLFYMDGDTVRKDLSEYKGKLLVLDFWATWCAICLAQMKEKQLLFSTYPDETTFLMVNSLRTKDKYEAIQARKDKISESSLGGKIESIIEDSYLQGLFPTKSYPRYVWIGPSGNVVAITMALSVTEGHLKGVLDVYREYNEKYGEK